MAYNEKLNNRVREALADVAQVVEKGMAKGSLFMVNGKVCVTTGDDEITFRIDPALHKDVLKQKGCRTMMMKGKEYKGYITVSEEGMKTQKQFDYWIGLALDFNRRMKAAPEKKK